MTEDQKVRVDAALAAVSAALRELHGAIDTPGSGLRAEKRFVTESLVATFERLAEAERALLRVRAEMEAEPSV